MNTNSIPALEGVEHRFIDLADGVTIHVAEAGPADGVAVMLVHGFPQHWWEWHEMIGPLAADGYRVLCPDLRGAGWSSAPPDRYLKTDMADDLAAILDRLNVGPVGLVAHDWGGPVALLMAIRHPEKVSAFFGINTVGPWLTPNLALLGHLWRFWYQIPMSIPVVGRRVIGDPKGRYLRAASRWAGGGFLPADFDVYIDRWRLPGHAEAGSRWYRTFQNREAIRWLRGEYENVHFNIPVRWLQGMDDTVVTPTLFRDYAQRFNGFQVETVDGAGHWIVEQRPDLVLDRLSAFLRDAFGPVANESGVVVRG